MKRFVEVFQDDKTYIFIDDEMIESFQCTVVDQRQEKYQYQGKLNLVSGKTIFLEKCDTYNEAFEKIENIIYYWDRIDGGK